MTKHNREKIVVALAIALVSCVSPLLLARNAWAKTPTDAKIRIEDLEKIGAKNQDYVKAQKDQDAAFEPFRNISGVEVETLRDILKAPKNRTVRLAAIYLLGSSRWKAKEAVPDLIKELKTGDQEVRLYSASALGYIGVSGREAVPALIKLLKNKNNTDQVRQAAAWALGQIGVYAGEAVEPLREVLKDKKNNHWGVRSNAAQALGNMGLTAKDAVDDLLTVFLDNTEYSFTRWAAATAIGGMGAEAEAAVPELIRLLDSKEKESRAARVNASGALTTIRPDSKEAIEALRKALKDPEWAVRHNAAVALGAIDLDIKTAISLISDLVNVLQDQQTQKWEVRAQAALTLGKINLQ